MAKLKVQPKKKSTFNKRNQLIVVSVVAILVVVALAAYQLQPAKKKEKKDNDDGLNKPPKEGDWLIDKPITIEKQNLTIHGSLIINEKGILYLQNSTLKVETSNQPAICASAGSELHILGSSIQFESTPMPYLFRADNGSVLEIKNSQIPFDIIVNASGSDLEHNTISGKYAGLSIGSSSNKIAFNTIKGMDDPIMEAAIKLENSAKNTISSNILSGYSKGLEIVSSNNNTIYNNSINAMTSTGAKGEGLDFSLSYDNEVSYNEISKSSVAVNLIGSKSNKFHHNNFLDNTKQVQDDASNKFDDGSDGNYWSDYKGFDLNKDGKGDLPYIINLSDRDNHPFMKLIVRP